MKVKQFKKLRPESGDIIAFSLEEFDTPRKRQELCESLGRVFYGKHIGIIFVNDVHDSIAIHQGLAKQFEEQRKGLSSEETREVAGLPEVPEEN